MRDKFALDSSELDGFTCKMLKVYSADENFERLARAKQLGEEKGGYTVVEISLAWLLPKPFPLVPVFGARTQKELVSCAQAASLSLPEQENG